jgi:hypothetical protein
MDDAQYWLSSTAGNAHGLNYMHSDPVEFTYHWLTSCKENWTYKLGILTCGQRLIQRTKENAYSVDTVSKQCRHCVETVLVFVQTLYGHFRLSKNSSPKKIHKVHYRHFLRVRPTVVMGQTGELIKRSPLTATFEQRLFANRQYVSTLSVSRHQPHIKVCGWKDTYVLQIIIRPIKISKSQCWRIFSLLKSRKYAS